MGGQSVHERAPDHAAADQRPSDPWAVTSTERLRARWWRGPLVLVVAPLAAALVVVIRDGPDLLLYSLLALAGAVLLVAQVSMAALGRLHHAVGTIVRRIASLVAAAVLFPVVVVCLYLPGLVVRAARAARSATSRGAPSPWQPYGVGLHDEQVDASRPFASTPRPIRMRRHGIGLALVVVAGLVAGVVVVRSRHPSSDGSPSGLTLTRPSDDGSTSAPAGFRSSKKQPFAAELSAPYSSLPPYRGVTWADELQRHEGNDPDITSRWVNVHDSVRASLPAPDCGCKPLKVWFSGGSAAFGYGQRDRHTIAADLVRLAERSGFAIEMENIGRAGSTLTVEIHQIRERLEHEDPPELIVFLDGFNDALFSTAFAFGDSQGTDAHATFDGLGAIEYIRDHPEAYLTSTVGAKAGADALAGYRLQRAQMEELARSHGIATAWFFQPDAFVNAAQFAGYDDLTNVTAQEYIDSPLSVALATMAEGLAADGMVDLRPVFADDDRPAFLGVVHQSEHGAAITAQAMYRHLEATLQSFAS